MSTDNRTTLNAADATTGWTGSGTTPATDNTTGFVYEGTNSISTQHSNTEDEVYTTSIGGTRNLSDATVYYIVKDNLIQSYINGGMMANMTDGTVRRGFYIAGNNATGIQLDVFWNGYKIDVSRAFNEATSGDFYHNFSGTAALTKTAVTGVGVGTVHLAKAQGNVDNIKVDRMSFIANGSYAFTINGGTSSAPETTQDIVDDSISNGWGCFANPIGAQYVFFAPTQWGNPSATADSYFEASDEQWVFLGDNAGGHSVDEDNFPFRLINNTTDTASFVLNNVSMSTVGTRATFDYSNADFDICQLDGCTFTNMGEQTFPVAATTAANRSLSNCTFNNCDTVNVGDMEIDDCVFNGHSTQVALRLDETTSGDTTISNLVFNRNDSPGSAVELNPSGTGPFTYNFDNWVFNDYRESDTTDSLNGRLQVFSSELTGTSHSVSLTGSSFAAGDLIVIIAYAEDINDVEATLPAGWYKYPGQSFRGVNQEESLETISIKTGSTSPGFQVFAKIADGTESGTSINITYATSQTRQYNTRVYITGEWSGNLETAIEIGPIQGTLSSVTTFDPAAWTPLGGPASGVLLFCAIASNPATAITTSDPGIGSKQTNTTGNASIWVGQIAAGTHNGYNPTAFSFSSGTFAYLPMAIFTGTQGIASAAVRIGPDTFTNDPDITINILNGGTTPLVWSPTSYTGTVTINTSVTVRVDGVAEGTAIKVVANETVGTITAGDVILQGLADSTGGLETTTFNYEGAFNPSGLDVLITARNQGLPTAAIADDGGVLTDETTAANSGTSNDMTLVPTTPAVNDAYYWGHPETFTGLKINISTAGTGLTITWEYWNGSSWAALSGVVDGTNSFTTAGLNTVTWTLPSWSTTTVNGQGPYYYVRARVSAVASPTQALGRWSSLDVTRYLPIPPQGVLQRTITSSGLTATLTQAVDSISTF